MDNPANPSRRWFLTGRSSPQAQPVAVLGGNCIAQTGVMCQSCREACPSDAIRMRLVRGGAPLPELDPALCTGCGDCLAPCPASAITLHEVVVNA